MTNVVLVSPITGGQMFGVSVSATMSSSQDNYSPAGYIAGITNRLLLTPAGGGSTIAGLVAATDGWSILVVNMSTTNNITFTNQNSGTSINQFLCTNGVSAILQPTSATILTYVGNQWMFGS